MRYLALVALCAACGGAPHGTSLPPDTVTPAHALAGAQRGATPGDTHGTRLEANVEAKARRVVDLDIIRIAAHANGPGGDAELTSVASADLFQQANEAARAGRQRQAIAIYRQLVTEFADSQLAPVSLFNIAAVYDAQGDFTATVTALVELVAEYPNSRASIDGRLCLAALQADHRQWADAAATLDAALAREDLWEAHVEAPYPRRIAVATRPAYVAFVHTRVRGDLEKALDGHRMNVELAKAYGVDTPGARAASSKPR